MNTLGTQKNDNHRYCETHERQLATELSSENESKSGAAEWAHQVAKLAPAQAPNKKKILNI